MLSASKSNVPDLPEACSRLSRVMLQTFQRHAPVVSGCMLLSPYAPLHWMREAYGAGKDLWTSKTLWAPKIFLCRSSACLVYVACMFSVCKKPQETPCLTVIPTNLLYVYRKHDFIFFFTNHIYGLSLPISIILKKIWMNTVCVRCSGVSKYILPQILNQSL